MSRWFRHYAGMMRDDKLVRVSLKSKQSVERVCWIYSAILESAAEFDDDGRYEIDVDEIARFLRCKTSAVSAVVSALLDLGRVTDSHVTAWSKRQFKSDRSNDRVTAYREKKKASGNADVTLQERDRNSPETETETDRTLAKANASEVDPDTAFWTASKAYLGTKRASLIGQWVRDHGREATAAAIAAAQVERAVDPVQFIQGRFRLVKREAAEVPVC